MGKVKYISTLRDFFEKSIEALRHYFDVFWLPYCHTLWRHQYLICIIQKSWISLEWDEIWQKGKRHSSSLLKAFQIRLFFNTSIFHFIGTLNNIMMLLGNLNKRPSSLGVLAGQWLEHLTSVKEVADTVLVQFLRGTLKSFQLFLHPLPSNHHCKAIIYYLWCDRNGGNKFYKQPHPMKDAFQFHWRKWSLKPIKAT